MHRRTYTFIYLHVVFSTWDRYPFLDASIRSRVFAYIATVARDLGVADVHVGGYEDHVHLLGRFDPAVAPAAVIGQIKFVATRWLRTQNVPTFRWQRGYGAFSVSRGDVPRVIRYIQRQEQHHAR